jgi:hypothetical protein
MKKRIASVLMLVGAALGQQGERDCKDPADNVYRDGPCLMYQHCEWTGRKYRAEGHCWKVTIDAPEKKAGDFHRTVVEICDDKSKKPRSCQKEFDERDASSNEDECWQRHFQMHKQAFYSYIGSGQTFTADDEKNFIEEQILMDRPRAIKECSAP